MLEEVRAWDPALLERPQLVAATKRDAVQEPDPLSGLVEMARSRGLRVMPVSAVTGQGLLELKRALAGLLAQAQVPALVEGA